VKAGLRSALRLLERVARALEDGVIVSLLAVLALLASSQIVLRNVFSASLPWSDELARLLVLWLALGGAVAASRDGRQIRIDVVSRMIPERWTWLPDSIATAFTAVVCGLLCWQSVRFVLDSHAFGDVVLGGFPAWLVQIVLPVGFGIMSYRYAVRTLAVLVDGR
jgi:TRAP-type C4-dicarboxylate transport system permease small subunit